MEQFDLMSYQDEIRAIARKNNCTLTAAVDRMIVNLNTFNEYNKGTGIFNYHVLGQQWGALTAAQKVAQKQQTKQAMRESMPKRRR